MQIKLSKAMSRNQDAGRNHSIKIDNSSFEKLEELGTNLTKQNSIQEKIKSKLKSGMLAIIRCKIFCLPICYPKI
jgi:hypothetical protein